MNKNTVKYSKTDEWAFVDGKTVKVGISSYAAMHLGDIVFLKLPEVGKLVTAGNPFGAIESVKSASDLYSPVTGKVVAVNTILSNQPELINQDPFATWIVEIEFSDASELDTLLTVSAYEAQLS